MPDDPQRCNPAEFSPRRLARKIESCIFRNALEEEQRAQKALYLLQTRDRQIAFLEKRVTELENVAANLHELTLRPSSRSLTLDRKKDASDISKSDISSKSDFEGDTDQKTALDFSNANSRSDNSDEKWYENFDTSEDNRIAVPRLKLSKSSLENSEKDIFSTAIDFVLEKRKCFTPNISFSQEEKNSEITIEQGEENLDFVDQKLVNFHENKEKVNLEGKGTIEEEEILENKMGRRRDGSIMVVKNSEKKIRAPGGKHHKVNLARTSASVPWIRRRHNYRKRLHGFESKTGKRLEKHTSDGDLTSVAFGTIDGASTDRRQGEGETADGVKKTEIVKNREQNVERAVTGAQETRLIADEKIEIERKTICTQTSIEVIRANEKNIEKTVGSNVNHFTPSRVHLEQKTLSAFWGIDEDPAPQWLIEEALNRGTEHSEQQTKGKIMSRKEAEYEKIISELEEKLAQAQDDLEEALRSKSDAKEKYKRYIENVKAEARKENEILQEKIVRICTSVLENFGPRTLQRKGASYRIKYRRKLKCHERVSSRLYRKLRMAVARSNKLKRELAEARKTLKTKSEEYQSISECFDQVKREMDSTETNLNNLIAENLALRQKMEETRDWLKHGMGKENHNFGHFRDVRKSRELSNLKKKVEEDGATISQLKNKLVRLESANANKGFLLNSYKSQMADLSKEKDQLVTKINHLENEICNVRRSNSQLKAKISVLNIEKDKHLSDNEKSKTDVTEKMEVQEIEGIKAKYEETIRSMNMKMMAMKNQNVEYSKAIKEFVKRFFEYQGDNKTSKFTNESEESEREAHETACNILNMTPEELSGFINGGTQKSVNPWIVELNRIISTNRFSEDLSKFLMEKVTRKAT